MIRLKLTLLAALVFLLPALAFGAPSTHICSDAGGGSVGPCATVKASGYGAAAADMSVVVSQSPSGSNPCANPSATLTTVSGTTSGVAATQIIAQTAYKIYICSLAVIGGSGTTPTFSLVTGTGANCGTGQAVLLPAFATAAGSLYAFASPVAVGPAGAALCYLDSGTTPVQSYMITYVQQ